MLKLAGRATVALRFSSARAMDVWLTRTHMLPLSLCDLQNSVAEVSAYACSLGRLGLVMVSNTNGRTSIFGMNSVFRGVSDFGRSSLHRCDKDSTLICFTPLVLICTLQRAYNSGPIYIVIYTCMYIYIQMPMAFIHVYVYIYILMHMALPQARPLVRSTSGP